MPSSTHAHMVGFFDTDADLVAELSRYVGEGLDAGESVVVVATEPHLAAVAAVLVQYGVDPATMRAAGRYVPLDAARMLTGFMVDGTPDPERFATTVGSVIDAAAAGGCTVRVYGEMVGLLWEQGNVTGALTLESLWNAALDSGQFVLLCGYSAATLADGDLPEVHQVCELHSAVHPPRSYATTEPSAALPGGAVHRSPVFLPLPAAVPAMRRFVIDVLRGWEGHEALLADAALVASELATNAVVHAVSPFRMSLSRTATTITIVVEDVGPALPQQRTAAVTDFSGRGIAIVAALSTRWGSHPVPNGKVVWAELDRC